MSMTPALSPLAVSTTSASTPASMSDIARSHASPKKPMAAATRSRPASSLVAFGYCSDLSKSFTVMSPRSLPSASMSGSFSILCCAKIATASSGSMPSGAVMRGVRVMTSRTRVVDFSNGETKRMSRLVMMPTSLPSPSTTGSPETRNRPQIASTSATVASGVVVTGFVIMPDSERLTLSTCSAWSAMERLRCSTPRPPCLAIAIAMRDSVTVSMAEERRGAATVIRRLRRVLVSASLGMTSVCPGSSMTSS